MNKKIVVNLVVHGHPHYYLSGRHSIRSILHYSDFDIFLLLGRRNVCRFPGDRRIQTVTIDDLPPGQHRSKKFLLKFHGLKLCLESGHHDLVVQLDADALFASPITAGELLETLGTFCMGMVEQKTIKGSNMGRVDFYNHYLKHSLQLIGPDQPAPPLDRFRFFNSGFVVGRTPEMHRLVTWALGCMEELESAGSPSQVGEHMIADQDYFQYWVHNVNPGCCIELPWIWNHCELWHDRFPDPQAKIVHFSNFCLGPDRKKLKQIAAFSRSRLPDESPAGWMQKIYRRFSYD